MKQHIPLENIIDFWNPIPISDGLNNKKGVARFVYLFLYHYFYHNHQFPDSFDCYAELIDYGTSQIDATFTTDEVINFFQNERQIYRYKDEIRTHFGYRLFEPRDIAELRDNFSSIFSPNSNIYALTETISKAFDNLKLERLPDIEFESLINKIQAIEEIELFDRINASLTADNRRYIDNYILSSNDFDGVCQFLRQDSSDSTRDNVKEEIKRLEILSQLPIASLDFFDNINSKQFNLYRRRFLTDTPERTKRRGDLTRYALASIFCFQRHKDAIDNLVDHLLHFIHQIKKTADSKQENLNKEIVKRLGDLDLLYNLAEINRDNPKDIIENAVYPTIPQAEIDQIIKTRDFARSRKTIIQESTIKRYSMRYRRTIFNIIEKLVFDSNNTLFLKAIQMIKQYQNNKNKYYPIDENMPMDGIISKQQQKFIYERDDLGNLRVLRKDYECAIFKLLRIKLRHKEVWVNGSFKYRDPIRDLPNDFEERMLEYFELLKAPSSAKDFINTIKIRMVDKIKEFDTNFPNNVLVNITKKRGKSWITLAPLEKIEEPKVIQKMKDAIVEKWGMIDLLDILKEVDLRENFTNCFNTAGTREVLDRETIRKRLLLSIFAFGTNTGLKRTAGASKGSVTFEELRHIRRFFFNKEDLREAINMIINGIFKIRNPEIWKSISTACAADSKQFGCFTKNLMTEWSPRHHNSGVMIYWHVSDQYICVYSQLKTCTSSEVASMLQGIMSQETDMEIESQYVDSHGKSELGFTLSYLENFDLLPRYKCIGNQKIYLPSIDFQVKNISEIVTRSINWELIEEQYKEMIKHAVALKIGTATAETIIRKFAKSNYQHPTFKAFMELGKAIKTIFLCRYLNSVELRQQINAGLNVVENWNSANDFIYYGKSGEISSNYRDDQEISMLCLHLLQTSVSYVNTLLVEDLLQNSFWREELAKEDFRALTALFYLHINPYGTFELDLMKRLNIV